MESLLGEGPGMTAGGGDVSFFSPRGDLRPRPRRRRLCVFVQYMLTSEPLKSDDKPVEALLRGESSSMIRE